MQNPYYYRITGVTVLDSSVLGYVVTDPFRNEDHPPRFIRQLMTQDVYDFGVNVCVATRNSVESSRTLSCSDS